MNYDALKLKNQLCFPLYAVSKEVTRLYKPFLDPLNLTYTQYITMMVLWENDNINVKSLGEKLYLDSGTLTPLLKKLEAQGLVKRVRNKDNERSVFITLTDSGLALKEKAIRVPEQIIGCLKIEPDEALTLYRILNRILEQGIDQNL